MKPGKVRLPVATYEALGMLFGYPTCCIKAFGALSHLTTRGPVRRKLEGTGYIPCAKCDKLPEEELIRQINEARAISTPFTVFTNVDSDAEQYAAWMGYEASVRRDTEKLWPSMRDAFIEPIVLSDEGEG